MDHGQELERIRDVYNAEYRPDANDRRYDWHPRNPLSMFFRHAQEYALVSLLNQAGLDLENMRLLDLGCGTGGLLRFLTNLGAKPGRLQGVDLLDYRVKQARSLCNQETGICMGDGGALPYQSQVFDLVSQFTVFSSILDDELRREAAAEITRVMKPGGYLLWYDMLQTTSDALRGLQLSEVESLFPRLQVCAMRRLHAVYTSRLLRRSWQLALLWNTVPGIKKTHAMVLLKNS